MPTADGQREIVFVSPFMPSWRGNGAAMRSAATIKLLHTWGARVHLIVVPLHTTPGAKPDDGVAELLCSWQTVNNPHPEDTASGFQHWINPLRGAVPLLLRKWNQDWQDQIGAAIKARSPDLVFMFRLYVAPFIGLESLKSTSAWLDLDERDSAARVRMAAIYAMNQDGKDQIARMEAAGYSKLEKQYLPLFTRIFASSRLEADSVRVLHADLDVRVMPNVYPFTRPQPPRATDGRARLLFVGNFGYYPNVDAVSHFSSSILPVISARMPTPIETMIVGSNLEKVSRRLSSPGLNLIGAVPDTTIYYADTDLVVVPLRSGGGTRIKILEAFSHSRAVVSTTIGAEGLEVENGKHLCIADHPDDFANSCVTLLTNGELRTTIAQRGHDIFLNKHSLERLIDMIPSLFDDVGSST